MRFTTTSAVLAAVLAFSAPASAVTFDFSGNGGLEDSYQFTSDGIGLTVTAGTITVVDQSRTSTDTVTVGGGAQVGQYTDGLGATSPGDVEPRIDETDLYDILLFDFSRPVRFVSVTFTALNNAAAEFELWFDEGGDGSLDGDYEGKDLIPPSLTFLFKDDPYIGKLFGIAAAIEDDHGNSAFKIKALTVSEVPLPAALPLLLTALGGLGMAGWRRRARA